MIALALATAFTQASFVQIRQTHHGYQVVRNGKPFFIKGAGGSRDLDSLVQNGGNSVRTWGVDETTGEFLDKCHKLGLTVCLGFWLRKAEDQFDYTNPVQIREQFEYIENYVKKYKNHPALLMWAVGNEMELGLPENQTEAMWKHVDSIAKMMKKEDENRHPVISVVADMWQPKMDAILKYTTSLDALGVNSYGGLPTLNERMKDWKKPYFITEFQHGNPTNGQGMPYNLPVEMTSTDKAKTCLEMYEKGIAAFPGRVLGSYVFYWDRSGVQTSSWYNMHIKTGEKLGSVDTMHRLWTGKEPKNRAPIVRSFSGDGLNWKIDAYDPDGDSLTYTLEVINEDKPRFVGDFEQDLGVAYKSKIASRFVLPVMLEPGRYRAYVLVKDGKGAAAVANTVYKLPL